jgi:hypothetical protein
MKACPPGRPRPDLSGAACRASATYPILGQNIVNLFNEIFWREPAQNEIDALEYIDLASHGRPGRFAQKTSQFKLIVVIFCINA